MEVKTRIAQGSYRDQYTLNNVIEADEIEGAGDFKITSDSLSSDAKYVTNKVFGTTGSTASIDNTMEQISGRAYANMSTQILGSADAFINQNRALLTSEDDSDVKIGLLSGYEDVGGTKNSLGYSGERGGIVLAKKLLDTNIGKTYGSIGYAVGEFNYDGGGKSKIETWDLAIYNLYAKDEVELKTNLSLNMNTHNTERKIKFDTINRTARAEFDSYSVSFGNEFSYGFDFGNYKIKPLAIFDLAYINQDAIVEDKADALNLSLPSANYLSAIGGVGLRGESKVGKNATLFAEAKYLHQFGNINKDQEATIEGWKQTFKVNSSEDKRDAIQFKVGGKLSYKNIDFTGDISKKFNDYDNQFKATAGISIKF